MQKVRQRGSSVYGGTPATMNAQTMIDVRVIADFHKFITQNGGTAQSISACIREVCYWVHEQLVKESMVDPCETIENAVRHLEGLGFNVSQIQRDRRNRGIQRGLTQESMLADFSQESERGRADELLAGLSDEDQIRLAAQKFLGAGERTAQERDALASLPTNLLAEEDNE